MSLSDRENFVGRRKDKVKQNIDPAEGGAIELIHQNHWQFSEIFAHVGSSPTPGTAKEVSEHGKQVNCFVCVRNRKPEHVPQTRR